MTNSVKLLLTIELEGGTLIRQSKPETINWTLTERDMNRTRIWKGDDGLNIVKRGTAFHHNLVNKECLQRIKLSLTAYLYMISDECPNTSCPKSLASTIIQLIPSFSFISSHTLLGFSGIFIPISPYSFQT